ncbi:PQQ-dependent dehydrogenase, methanol/ethanol family [Steroidobacter sp.]|uniref:PQQ-dependent dehydrogenase, methanol/ethanol family n=1 Tax=Steroidobacter sp. TaxID=1978227 RepID=UPI001A4E7CD7|nr:PQQ-dependent dehydrogenase, methanol/ethanol family [Steroidobacter sp.]MBL8270253.1 PQQ-dependent dehydrogenase, methanol/ethanol family [Steroidobacter sp.]
MTIAHRCVALGLLVLLSACQRQQSPSASASETRAFANVDDARLAGAESNADDWLSHGRTYSEQRFSPLAEINAKNVGQLELAWFHDLDTNRGQEATPIIVDGVMYTTTAWSKVVALDAASGKHLWTYDPKVPGATAIKACCDVVNRGVAVYRGKVYVGTLDGRLIALDAATGKPVWSVETTDPQASYTITGAPRVVKGKVIIGNGGADTYQVRGYVSAYDAETGKLAWRFYTVPGDPAKGPDGAASDKVLAEKALPTWFGKWYEFGGGGTAWDSIVYDQELDQLYVGTGNGLPWNRRIRSEGKGDNLFLCSIIALKPDTGEYLWHYQVNPGETWDYNANQTITLTDLVLDGQKRKVLMQAPKNGFFYVIDRENGKLLSAKNFVAVNWATGIDLATGRPQETPEARYEKAIFVAQPGGAGAHNWHPMAYSPAAGLAYIPAQELPLAYRDDPAFAARPKTLNTGIDFSLLGVPDDPAQRAAIAKMLTGRLIAWNPVTQQEAWHVDHAGPWNGGVLATAGDLVFQGTADKQLQAYRASNGERLWNYDVQTGTVGGPVSYRAGGEQYIAVMAGYGGAVPLALPALKPAFAAPNGRVLAFKIKGGAKLPAYTPVPLPPAMPTAEQWPQQRIDEGRGLYSNYCSRCHGASLLSSGILPDLRRSPMAGHPESFTKVVLEGALEPRGMISFAGSLTAEQVESIRAYVISSARLLQAQEAAQKQ